MTRRLCITILFASLGSTCQRPGSGLGDNSDLEAALPAALAPAVVAPDPGPYDGLWRVEVAGVDVFCLVVAQSNVKAFDAACAQSQQVVATLVRFATDVGGIIEFNVTLPSGNPGNYRIVIEGPPAQLLYPVKVTRAEVTATGTAVVGPSPASMSKV